MIFWALINAAISGFIYQMIRAPIMRAYLILNFVLIINPAFMWLFFDAAHRKFVPGDDRYLVALAYMALFNLMLGATFRLLVRKLPRWRRAQRNVVSHRLNASTDIGRVILITVILGFVGFISKLGLDAMGSFRMGHGGGHVDNPFLQLFKVFASFDLLALIVLGELRQIQTRPNLPLNAMFLTIVGLSVSVAMLTGSRSQTLTVLIIALLGHRDQVRRYWFVVYPAAVAVLPAIFMIFPLLGYYRRTDISFADANYAVEQSGMTGTEIMTDVLVTRLNYLEPLARVVEYVQLHGPAGGSVYWNNILGIIPRLIWPDKPEISNNSRDLGHQLGLVTLDDESTSVGLQVVGESFYEFGWFGLWVALFQALLFAIIHKNFRYPGCPAAMAVYIFATINMLQRDAYFAVIPGLLWLVIGISIFFSVYLPFLRRSKGTNTDESLPCRSTYR